MAMKRKPPQSDLFGAPDAPEDVEPEMVEENEMRAYARRILEERRSNARRKLGIVDGD